MNEFGEYLRELRGGRSLREMERLTGLSHTYLSTLEKGYDPRSKKERKPTPETLMKISLALNVSYSELMLKAGYVEIHTLGATIQKFRKQKEMTIEELSLATLLENENGELERISVDRLLDLENGRDKNMSLFEIVALAHALHIQPDQLVSVSDIETPQTTIGKINLVSGIELVEKIDNVKSEILKKATELNIPKAEKMNMFYDLYTIKGQQKDIINDLKKISKNIFNQDFKVNVENNEFKDDEYFKNIEIGNLILFHPDINYKGQPLSVMERRLLFEKVIEVMEQLEK